MKTGIVIVPFVDGKTGNAYQINDDYKANKKRFEKLLKAGLISDGKEVSEEETETTEEVQNEETVEEESEEESVEPENGEEVSEEESNAE